MKALNEYPAARPLDGAKTRADIRAVLFDIDGTLIHTSGAGIKAFERTGATLFRLVDGVRGLPVAGRTDPAIVRDFFVRHQIEPSEENFRQFFDTYVFWLDELLRHSRTRIHPGVVQWIEELRDLPSRPMIGLLTGNIRLGAEIKLRHFDLWDCFQIGAFGDDHEDRNQLAVIARDRVGSLLGDGLKGDQILVVGDTPHDIACAQSIQAHCLAVATGGSTLADLQGYHPTWAVTTLEEISVAEIWAPAQ